MGKTGDSEARKAAETLKKYCKEHEYCENCIFAEEYVCGLLKIVPCRWKSWTPSGVKDRYTLQ